jgi:hypothetical protein
MALGLAPALTQASLMIARIMPMSTNTTIAPCIQIQVGDIARQRLLRAPEPRGRRGTPAP